MGKRAISVLFFGITFLTASTGWAAATWSLRAFTSDGSAHYAMTLGAQVILDISVRTSDQAYAFAGSVNDYDNRMVRFNAAESFVSTTVLNGVCLPEAGCSGGLENLIGTTVPLEERAVGGGLEVEFFLGASLTPASGNGAQDPGVVTGVAGDPQFRLVFDVFGLGTTTLQIGTFETYLDAYTGTEDRVANNTSIEVAVVPEPSTALLLGMGLAGLSAVQGSRVRGARACLARQSRSRRS